jgi:hypothetical protein
MSKPFKFTCLKKAFRQTSTTSKKVYECILFLLHLFIFLLSLSASQHSSHDFTLIVCVDLDRLVTLTGEIIVQRLTGNAKFLGCMNTIESRWGAEEFIFLQKY